MAVTQEYMERLAAIRKQNYNERKRQRERRAAAGFDFVAGSVRMLAGY